MDNNISPAIQRVGQLKEDLMYKYNRMMELLGQLLWTKLQTQGWFAKSEFEIDNEIKNIGVIKKYRRWTEQTLRLFVENNYLSQNGTIFSLAQPPAGDFETCFRLWEEEKGKWADTPSIFAQSRLVETTLHALPGILTGKTVATDIMFPGSSMDLVEGIYKNNKAADFFNEIVADTVISYIEILKKKDPGVRIKIIEIGAGTGGTSAMIFNQLKDLKENIEEYAYTDISSAFLKHGEKEYGSENPYLTYKICNVEKPIISQGFQIGNYHIAIATNVLHATKNISRTLKNTKALLRKNGLLLLNEISGNSLFTHLTFGLLDGWWLYDDEELRIPGSPGLFPDSWKNILESEGFQSVRFPVKSAHELGQQIIIAQSDGNVLQEQKRKITKNKKKDSDMNTYSGKKRMNPDDAADRHSMGNKIKDIITQKLAESLKLDRNLIDGDEPFLEYGLDSIVSVQLVQSINQALSIQLETTSLFNYSTINQLAEHIIARYHTELAASLKKDGSQPQPLQRMDEFTSQDQPDHISNRFKSNKSQIEVSGEAGTAKSGIAIIGVSAKFPKSVNVEELGNHLSQGDNLVEKVTRWDLSQFYKDSGKIYCDYGSFLDNVDEFDPLFFNISGYEATFMDPQQRIFLEECWKALEDAGYVGTEIGGRLCGIYVGCGSGDYFQLLGDNPPPQAFWGNSPAIIPARIAYYLNLQGPAIAIDTACSSSLVAIHNACQGLWNHETEMALAGGIYIANTPIWYQAEERAGMLSKTGRCNTFDESADGLVPGEGAGVIVLKRIEDALNDGDHIYGVIRGSAINQDGTTSGITAPSAVSQERLERSVYDTFQIDPGNIQMIEAHGTGTKLGDPIEIEALTRAFRHYTDRKNYCAIGSIKTNIGHSHFSAGIAGVIKILLSLKYKQIFPSLHFKKPNSFINFKDSPFYVNTALKDWEVQVNTKRMAAVSSFGFSGTNAHIVIEEAPLVKRSHEEKPGYLIVLSARSTDHLRKQVEQLLDYCRKNAEIDCGNLSFTLLLGRKHFEHRFSTIIKNKEELEKTLEQWLNNQNPFSVSVSDLSRKNRREQTALLRYGNESIQKCSEGLNEDEYHETLSAVADLYMQGYKLNLADLFSMGGYNRLSLPTYPFSREKYWVDVKSGSLDKSVKSFTEPFSLATYEEILQESVKSSGTGLNNKTIIFLLSGTENQNNLAEKILELGQNNHIIFIQNGPSYQRTHENLYTVVSNDIASFESAFSHIHKDFKMIDAVCYLWALESKEIISSYDPIVNLIKASALVAPKKYILGGLLDGSINQCYFESWTGFERSLGFLMPKTTVSIVLSDNLMDGEQINIEALANNHLAELDSQESGSVFYKEGKRFIIKMKRAEIHSAEPALKTGGTYLITGGMGGIGILLAQYLADNKKANLVLVGRSKMDAEKEKKIKQLEKNGSQVIYLEAEVCNIEQMNQVYQDIINRFGGLNGIFHLAGLQGKQNILNNTVQNFNQILKPKIKGTIVLDEMVQEKPIDFICYFSSSSAILGDFGACDYAVANRFLMSHTYYRNKLMLQGHRKGKAFVINWPIWKDGGMVYGKEETEMYLRSSGQRELESLEGLELLEKVLNGNKAQVLVMAGQVSRIDNILNISNLNPAKVRNSGILSEQKTLIQAGLTLRDTIENDLAARMSALLKIPEVNIQRDKNLMELGFDSLSLGEFSNQLNQYYQIEIMPSIFFEYSTLSKISDYFVKEYNTQLQNFYSEEFNESGSSPYQEMSINTIEQSSQEYNFRQDQDDSIAIIGMSGRFPEARNVEEMWQNLKEKKNTLSFFPKDRSVDELSNLSAWKCGCIPGVSEFDPLFFEISEREAESMDPRQRLLLEESWNALEDAGYGRSQIKKSKIGMFVGVEQGSYFQLAGRNSTVISNHDAVLAARLAYFLDFSGPVMGINTACSSGLTAVHQACMALQAEECDTVIAAGVNIILLPEMLEMMDLSGMLSSDNTCYAFDKRANGLVAGEAVAAVVLKKLSRAVADGDPIHAVIKGSGINYDGRTNGITSPSGGAQRNLIQSVYDRYKINPENIEYIVAHGTGTKLGDPIEVNALTEVFSARTKKIGFCALTSNKPNFGHTFAASGLVSLMSMVKAFEHNNIPASLNFKEGNEYIKWKDSPFYVNVENKPWYDTQEKRRMGAVSSFGVSGTNVHVVLESYSNVNGKNTSLKHPVFVVPFSAKNQEALQGKIKDLIFVLKNKKWSDSELTSLCYTLQEGRCHFDYRAAITASSQEEILTALQEVLNVENAQNIFLGTVSKDFKSSVLTNQSINNMIDQIKIEQNSSLVEYQEKILALVKWYCQGYEIPWSELYGRNKPVKLSLPGYPFLRTKYWVSVQDSPKMRSDSGKRIETTMPFIGSGENLLISLFSKYSSQGNEILEPDQKIQDLGIDSINIMRLSKELAISLSGKHDNADVENWIIKTILNNDITISGLAANLAALPEQNEDITGLDLDVISSQQKKDPQNIVVNHLKYLAQSDRVTGKLIVDETHPFFFDHPLDHISGLQLLEAMSQAAKALCINKLNLNSSSPLFIKELSVVYKSYCKKEGQTVIEAELNKNSEEALFSIQAEVKQDKAHIADSTFLFALNGLTDSKNNSLLKTVTKYEICDPKIINKTAANNVLISSIQTEGSENYCYLILQPDSSYLNDFTGDYVDMVVIAEACRQSFRLFLNWKYTQNGFIKDMKGIATVLKKIRVSVNQPIHKNDTTVLQLKNLTVESIGKNNILELKGDIIKNKTVIGVYEIESLFFDEKIL